MYDICHWMLKLPHASLEHVNREQNAVVDALTRKAHSINSLYQTFSIPPVWLWLLPYLYQSFTV